MKKVLLLALLLFGFGINTQKSTEDEMLAVIVKRHLTNFSLLHYGK